MDKRNYNFKDLTGKRFGYFTVLRLGEIKNGMSKWICQCDCGNVRSVYGTNLTRGLSKSCGCKKHDLLKKSNRIDLIGQKFGRLTVISFHELERGDTYFNCLCDCGREVVVKGQDLKRGSTKSCGCLKETFEPSNKTHGMSKTRLFKIWNGMKQRCYNPNNEKYPIYGGRGITVCPEWIGEQGFQNFYDWSMGNGYTENLTIDRIDTNGNYEPSNCKWSTLKEQANNTRSTVFLTYKGETKPVSEWSEITGIRQDTLTYRKRHGWTDEECIEIPLNKTKGKHRKKK